MKNVFFIYPNPNKANPRGIRIFNISQNLKSIEPAYNYEVLTFNNKVFPNKNIIYKINKFNLIYILFRYLGVFRIGRKVSKIAKTLDPYVFIHFLIKLDILIRARKVKNENGLTFVVVVSPFSNYLIVPWLRKMYPKAKIICDIGDPLYKNTARWNNDDFSKEIEHNALILTDAIIVTNTVTMKHFVDEFNYMGVVSVIPQGVNMDLINNISNSINKIEKGSLAYAGRFYEELRSPQELYNYIESQNYFTLKIYGKNKVSAIENVNFFDSMPQEILFEKLKENEILIFIDNKQGMQSSGKIFELLSFRKPILFIKGNEESESFLTAKTFPNVFFAENQVDSIRESLMGFNSDNFSFSEETNFSWKFRATKYVQLL